MEWKNLPSGGGLVHMGHKKPSLWAIYPAKRDK